MGRNNTSGVLIEIGELYLLIYGFEFPDTHTCIHIHSPHILILNKLSHGP